jgi:hypothetical protein
MGIAWLRSRALGLLQHCQVAQKRMLSRRTSLLLLPSKAQSRQVVRQQYVCCDGSPTWHWIISCFDQTQPPQKLPARRSSCAQTAQVCMSTREGREAQTSHHAVLHVLPLQLVSDCGAQARHHTWRSPPHRKDWQLLVCVQQRSSVSQHAAQNAALQLADAHLPSATNHGSRTQPSQM